PAAPSHYDASDLDGMPQLLAHGSAVFPSSLARKGVRRGTVVLEVEIAASGGVRVRRVVSSTHPELVPAARRVAKGARFTPPKHRGKVVKAVMRWPITIEK
ncbi:MAG: energy transducer TonB, partial [Akkermansiaceae bacterium]|nr:energy transducer TonB [Akkermansiaceae bacterium]